MKTSYHYSSSSRIKKMEFTIRSMNFKKLIFGVSKILISIKLFEILKLNNGPLSGITKLLYVPEDDKKGIS